MTFQPCIDSIFTIDINGNISSFDYLSQKELKITQSELKRTQKEIKNCNKRNDELNYKIIQLEKYQILSNLSNAEVHQFIGDRKVKMLK